LTAIRAYIAQFSPLAAQRMAQRLVAAGESLDQRPERGRRITANIRELTVIRLYIIRYQIQGATVSIIRIRHGAMAPD
jgi:plasmid stabilization system protein ParE